MLRALRREAAPAPSLAFIDVAHDGETFRVALRRVATARRFTLRVRAATRDVVLTMPTRAAGEAARAFVERQAAWIAARLRRLAQPVAFAPDAIVPVRGEPHRIVSAAAVRGTVWLDPTQRAPGEPPRLVVAGDPRHLERRVADFLRREARLDLVAAVKRHAAAIKADVASVTLRDTTSRWGSCTAKGALNFSWRLILAPPFVLDYLAAHEVAHLAHMNHSDRFWALTQTLAPQTDRAEAWLRAHGPALHRFGPSARL